MVKQFSSFSPCGRNFTYCGPDGKVKIWDTRSGILKQEFVPNLHLNQPCISYIWLNLSSSNDSSWKTKKRKSDKKSNRALALGTNNGSIALYSLAEGKVICTLQGGVSAPVPCLAWSDTHGLFSAANNIICIWNLESKRLERKWNCGKGKITSIDVQDNSSICVTASLNFKVWDIETNKLLRVLSGHSDVVTNLHFINNHHFLSTAVGERHVFLWNSSVDGEGPVARFMLSDNASGDIKFHENDGRLFLAAITQSGVLSLFSYLFNGKVKKSIKPVLQVEVANSERQENGGVGSAAVGLIPIVGCHLESQSSAMIAYGTASSYTFENIELKESKETLCLLRVPSTKPDAASKTNLVTEEIVGEENYVPSSSGVKRLISGVAVGETPLEARVANLSCDDIGPGAQHSLAQLLAQGLQSKDKSLVDTVLFRKDPLTVRHTVSRLPPPLLSPLIKHLVTMLRSKSVSTKVGAAWVTAALSAHGSQLLADGEALNSLEEIRAMAETRLSLVGPLAALAGRLSLLVDRPSSDAPLPAQQPLLVYNDEDSSDEGSSIGERNEISESEDKWEELSDKELSTDNMSS